MLDDYDYYELDGKKLKPNIIKTDIDDNIKLRAFELAFISLNKYSVEKDISDYIKENLDKEFESSWQCVVGIIK